MNGGRNEVFERKWEELNDSMKKESTIHELKGKEFFNFLNRMVSNKGHFNKEDIIQALLVMSLNPIDYNLAENLCTTFIESKDYEIKNLSIISIGHIARVYKKLVDETLYNKVKELYFDKESPFSETASDTLDDIQIFLGIQKPKSLSGDMNNDKDV